MENLLGKCLTENIMKFQEILADCDDIVYRQIEIGKGKTLPAYLIYADALADDKVISEFSIQALREFDKMDDEKKLIDKISKDILNNASLDLDNKINNLIESILSGDTVLLVDKINEGIILATRSYPSRTSDEPQTETVIRGARDGFVESSKVNLALIRRRIKDPKLKVKNLVVGRRTLTNIGILYIEDIANKEFIDEVIKRIGEIDIDGVIESYTIESLIEDDYLSPFPQVTNTERPDEVVSCLLSGKVAILIDNTPFALSLPATLGTMLTSTEDYFNRWPIASLARILRFISMHVAVMAPALYVALTAFNTGVIPTPLTIALAASRTNVPFPAIIEALLMELMIELIRESGTRISGPVGTTVGIVGGLIIGQAAVEAGIVSPLVIITVAITTLASFTLPNYDFASGIRFVRFIFVIIASIFGLFGVVIGMYFLLVHWSRLESFGVPYFTPYSGMGLMQGSLKDTLVKAPTQFLDYRPVFTFPKNKKRMKRKPDDE